MPSPSSSRSLTIEGKKIKRRHSSARYKSPTTQALLSSKDDRGNHSEKSSRRSKSPTFSRSQKRDGKKSEQKDRSERSKSPATQALSSSNSDRNNQSDKPSRSKSPKLSSFPASSSRRRRRPNDINDNCSSSSKNSSQEIRGYQYGYESPTESLSSLSSAPFKQSSSAPDNDTSNRNEKDCLKHDIKGISSSTISKRETSCVYSSEDGTIIEMEKITALVEEELQSQRTKHKDQVNRKITKFKHREEKFERKIEQLRKERDDAMRELEKCMRSYGSQEKAIERNELSNFQEENQIKCHDDREESLEKLRKERVTLFDDVARAQREHQKIKDELSTTKVRFRKGCQERISATECSPISCDAEMNEGKKKEVLLNNKLDTLTKMLRVEKDLLKNKNKEFDELHNLYGSTKTALRSVKKAMVAKKEEINEKLRLERESRKRNSEDHERILKLKNDEISIAETTILAMRAELKSTREAFKLKERSTDISKEGNNIRKGKTVVVDPDGTMLRGENSRLNAEVKQLQKQLESYLANLALQQEFCDSLKSQIYKEQENGHYQVKDIHKLRKHIKNQEKIAVEKDLQIDQLKQLFGTSSISSVKIPNSTRDVKGGRKSSSGNSVRALKSYQDVTGERKSSLKK